MIGKKLSRLDAFRREVNYHLSIGILADMDLPVTGADGGCPVVVALDEEPLLVLLERLRAVGGAATVFVRGNKTFVRMATVVNERETTTKPDDDMSVYGQQPGPPASVGMFLDWVERCPNGVAIGNAAVGHSARARNTHRVEWSAV